VGPHGLGLLTLLAGLAPGADWRRGGAAAVVLLAAGWGWGALRLAEPVAPRADAPVVRLVQPNAAQELKWEPAMQRVFYERHLAETRAPADPAPDVTIWSETAVPFVLGYAEELQAESAAAAGPDGRLILGIRRVETDAAGERWYNSLAVLDPDGRPAAVYDKAHLVPFGEYIPFGPLIGRLLPSLAPLTQMGFSAGPGPRLVAVPGLPPFLPLICYEAIFPGGMRAPGGRPEWIVQVTNDAWFGTLAGPYQHLAQARARAIEQGLPLARAANTGVSAMIDARGQVVASLDLGVAGRLDAALPPALAAPLYARTGDWPLLALTVFGLGLTLAFIKRGNLGNSPR
jgi:apolipoprotein N-acyltransferase